MSRQQGLTSIPGMDKYDSKAAALIDLGLREEVGPAGSIWIRERLDAVPPCDPLPRFVGLFNASN